MLVSLSKLITDSTFKMLFLHCSQKLATLERILIRSFPESLKVYGSVFHINRGNPFNLEVLVDNWPQFNSVISRPSPKEMTDDLDNYKNSYFLFTKDPDNLQDILTNTDAINWKQVLQIQTFQQNISEVINSICSAKMLNVESTRTVLYVKDGSWTRPELHMPPQQLQQGWEHSGVTLIESAGKVFRISPLNISHAELVNNNWGFGGNEQSLKYIQRCIQHLPNLCVMDENEHPVSWTVMEESGEIRMGYTLPEYRRMGISKSLVKSFLGSLIQKNFPVYMHVAENNENAKGVPLGLGFHIATCGWYQWKCSPMQRSERLA
ncbi:putative glycine N-acyltransferase-like protein 1B [Microcaecilia unicolor]|uniref:Glycine N-acyltransferase-like protein n=1 Tax=Microcaecilia unicolor TaxID=1415580 RepID=A0A6P7ZCD9_9AMPH|nr:putative glycine N-acyltransferase-like protein 1B [Microcaecilia unicolor]